MRRALLGVVPALLACAAGEGSERDGAIAAAADVSGNQGAPVHGNAMVVGTVQLTGGPAPNPTIDMSIAPECLAYYGGGRPTDFVIDGQAGALANVFVYVKSGLPEPRGYDVPSRAVAITQHECRLKPRVVGVMAGQTVEFQNGDELAMDLVGSPRKNDAFTVDLAKDGMPVQHRFLAPEVMVPLDSRRFGWQRAYVGVLDHPFFAVTDRDGSFRIERLPPGTYELEAWHEMLGTRAITVRVPAAGTVRAEFSFAVPQT